MKKLGLVLLLTIGMTISFAAIGLVMLFALKVVSNMDDVHNLIVGKPPGVDTTLVKQGPVAQVQDALLLLQQQKQELEQDLNDLKAQRDSLIEKKDKLGGELDTLQQKNQADSQSRSQTRSEHLAQTVALYNAMRPSDAATIMDGLSDDLVLEILPRLDKRQAARILNSLSDDKRKARLSTLLVEGQTAQN